MSWGLSELEWNGERLMAVTAIQDVREVLVAYPELADVAVLTHVQEPVGQVL